MTRREHWCSRGAGRTGVPYPLTDRRDIGLRASRHSILGGGVARSCTSVPAGITGGKAVILRVFLVCAMPVGHTGRCCTSRSGWCVCNASRSYW